MNDLEKLIDESIVMNESFLAQLNQAIDKTIKVKQRFNIDYNMLQKVLSQILKNGRFRKIGSVDKIIPIKKAEILSVALNFFESIDEEFYQEAVKVIFGQRYRTKMGIYNLHKIKSFEEKDENGMQKYTKTGSVTTYYGSSYVHIPLKERFQRKESRVLAEDEGTLEDLYTVVHEIAHLFDLNPLYTALTVEEILHPDRNNSQENVARELLCEATTIAFEGLLTNYLLEKRLYPEEAVKDYTKIRGNSSLRYAQKAYSKLVLAAEKEKNGEITIDFIEKMMKENNMSVQDVRRTARKVIDEKEDALYSNRYAMGWLVSPTIIKAYEDNKEDGVKVLKAYLKAVHDDDFKGALTALGISQDEKGIETLVRNMKSRDAKINEQRER